ncbi:hypothetical protein [Thalassobaculum sp.]|uniref:hypothetical protein n=1 Tax=Thalassobaculum sp. TaxID=2022740 RepID=UPI0032ED6952
MTTSPIDATANTPAHWVLRRSDPGGDEVLPGQDTDSGGESLGFGDLLDVLNPLQHLPVVGTLYRALTGDTMTDTARMAGGALYGGPLGLISALANVVVEHETGHDIGDTALAWLHDAPETAVGSDTMVAAAPAAPAEPTPPEPASPPVEDPNRIVVASFTPRSAQTAPAERSEAPATTQFEGRTADRLDAFIRSANAVKRPGPMPGSIGDTARLQAAALKPPGIAGKPKDGSRETEQRAEPVLALAGNDAGTVNEWMLRALEKYEHMQKQETG